MLVGFLLPLLRRLSSRAQALVGVAVMLFGLALTATWAGLGASQGTVLLIRFGILLVLVGAALCVRLGVVSRRKRALTHKSRGTPRPPSRTAVIGSLPRRNPPG